MVWHPGSKGLFEPPPPYSSAAASGAVTSAATAPAAAAKKVNECRFCISMSFIVGVIAIP